jgi:putative endonuclease
MVPTFDSSSPLLLIVALVRSENARWWLYVLRCGDGSLYTGIALDVAARLAAHREGKGARYTRGRGPLELLAKTRCHDKGEALSMEIAFKRLSRESKELVLARGLGRFVRRIRRERAS